jgi:hypothetical protein
LESKNGSHCELATWISHACTIMIRFRKNHFFTYQVNRMCSLSPM